MVNALKRMDKKFLIMAGAVICLPLILIIFLAIIQGCGNNKITHEKYEQKMISALEKYAEDSGKLPEKEGEILTVELSTLVKKEYIKPEYLFDTPAFLLYNCIEIISEVFIWKKYTL